MSFNIDNFYWPEPLEYGLDPEECVAEQIAICDLDGIETLEDVENSISDIEKMPVKSRMVKYRLDCLKTIRDIGKDFQD